MPKERGRSLSLSLPRRWMEDMLHSARRVPVIAGERPIKVRALADARRATKNPPSWQSLVTKGMGMVSMKIPALRHAYMPYPWPHLYEAPYSVASVIFDRMYNGEHATFMAPLLHPERLTLGKIQDKVQSWIKDPIEAHGVLRRLVRNAKPPRLIRRFLWWSGMNWNGCLRARNFGTFGVNTVANLRGRVLQFQTPITSVWYYGSVSKTGEMMISGACDHRVFDGYTAAWATSELESAFNNELLEEVRSISREAKH